MASEGLKAFRNEFGIPPNDRQLEQIIDPDVRQGKFYWIKTEDVYPDHYSSPARQFTRYLLLKGTFTQNYLNADFDDNIIPEYFSTPSPHLISRYHYAKIEVPDQITGLVVTVFEYKSILEVDEQLVATDSMQMIKVLLYGAVSPELIELYPDFDNFTKLTFTVGSQDEPLTELLYPYARGIRPPLINNILQQAA